MAYKLLVTGVGALLVGASMNAAQAADIVEPVAYDWTGPFIGLQGGYAWGNNDTSTENSENGPEPISFEENSGSLDLNGFVGGLHAGYNWHLDNSLVFGFVGDIELADMKGDAEVTTGDFVLSDLDGEIDWLGSLRLRAGFAADRALFYATGGLAVGGAELSIESFDGSSADNNETKWGWTIGGGVEYAVTDALSAFLEYRYTDLGSIDVKLDIPEGQRESEADLDFHAVRLGLSWHFGSEM